MALGAIETIKSATLNPKDFAIAGVTDGLQAVKTGEMTTILQDARAQAQGTLDRAITYAKKGDCKPESNIWEQYKDMPWNGGKDKTTTSPGARHDSQCRRLARGPFEGATGLRSSGCAPLGSANSRSHQPAEPVRGLQ